MLGLKRAAKSTQQEVLQDELPASLHVPFSHHYDEHTICNRDGTMFQVIAVEGIAFETVDDIDIISEKENRNHLFSGFDEYTALYSYTLRREEQGVPEGDFEPNTLPDEINKAYLNLHGHRKAYINEHYIVVARCPAIGAQKTLKDIVQLFYKPFRRQVEHDYRERREQLGQRVLNVIKRLKDYGPRLLTVNELNGCKESEPLCFLSQLLNHRKARAALPRMDLAKYLPAARHIFGHETIEIRHPDRTRFAAILSIKEYGTPTDAGMLDALLKKPIEMTISQGFMVIDRQRALKLLDDAQRFLIQSEDYAESQAAELQEAMDDLASGRLAVGEHAFTVCVFADSPKELLDHIATVTNELESLGGLRCVREDLNLENAFWAMLPGNGRYVTRGTPITSKNFAGFSSFHNQPTGQRENNHWGPACSVLPTRQGTPYFLNLHEHDLGHTTLIGPSGYGKTLLLCFLLSQAMKYRPRMVYLDFERGADIFLRALGGDYRIVSPTQRTGWNPLQLPDTKENRAFLADWLGMLLTANGEQLSASEREVIAHAIDGNYGLPIEHRQLAHIAPFLGTGTADSLAGRLRQWYGTGQRAYLFDNPSDELSIARGVLGFDMTHLLKDDIGRNPMFLYLLHRIDQSLDGYPTIIPIDEAWAFFKDDYFAPKLEEKLKVIRRKNGLIIMGTNDVTDAAASDISGTIITQSATNIFFGNNKAVAEDYKKFGLTSKEINLIKDIKRNDYEFLLKQGSHSVVLKLDLTGMEQYIPVLSSNEKNALRLEEIRRRVGDVPENWLPEMIDKGAA